MVAVLLAGKTTLLENCCLKLYEPRITPKSLPALRYFPGLCCAGLLCISLLGLPGCQDNSTNPASSGTAAPVTAGAPQTTSTVAAPSSATASNPITPDPAAVADGLTVLIFGDSISAAYGIERENGWAALLQERLSRHLPQARAINASVSGETTQGGRARLPAALARHQPDLVYIELGGNDALRGYPVSQMSANLSAMVEMAQASGARVVLLGMQIPPNYGPRYTREFAAAFATVAQATEAHLVPFFLDGVALEAGMIQGDGIHPTTLAQPILLETGWRALVATLADAYPELTN